jgi:IMP and pyridine-specific 5'-nucleotidase
MAQQTLTVKSYGSDFAIKNVTGKAGLTRAGHTQERDGLIEFLQHDLLKWMTLEEAAVKLQELIHEFMRNPKQNRLRKIVPNMSTLHTDLMVVEAYYWYDEIFKLSTRRHVRPSFADLRHILNFAQMGACAPQARLITCDGDGTIYTHNQNIENPELVTHILNILRQGLYFGLVTAAGYPGKAERYEQRIGLLLQTLWDEISSGKMSEDVLRRFFVMGGESNYLLHATKDCKEGRLRLHFVPDEEWKTPQLLGWTQGQIDEVLDRGTAALKEASARLNIPFQIIRKERAVGMIPTEALVTVEDLDEMVLSVHHELHNSPVPFCAFNSRSDVWLDIGSKGLGIRCEASGYYKICGVAFPIPWCFLLHFMVLHA